MNPKKRTPTCLYLRHDPFLSNSVWSIIIPCQWSKFVFEVISYRFTRNASQKAVTHLEHTLGLPSLFRLDANSPTLTLPSSDAHISAVITLASVTGASAGLVEMESELMPKLVGGVPGLPWDVKP